ncbi:hypothetical protein PFICI_01593 [Pestalotiopsis fici W106-1]|uniref:Heterokaryon incompatibility domain-containing protein n=1 Tax=Pestalotiopsis fici (strain W106-1 / CGMCC3.15140) TaxID=1229662 RepID=W3XP87_PESFW|nr:uncharacterized protein PFICI_01593 [Pestalotiopsis fici W106-1]ETS87765.1 hypothetical protein PFICI_01593 [Pestalotiopsis fici W106-1]
MSLCNICHRSTQEWLIPRLINIRLNQSNVPEPLYWWHQPSWESLSQAASQGCPLCCLIVAEGNRPQRPDRYGTLRIHSREVQDEDATRLRWQVSGGGWLDIFSKEKQLNLSLRIAFDDESRARAPEILRDVFINRKVSTAPNDDRNMANIQHWIETCRANHPVCSAWANRNPNGKHLPTRVIDVSTGNDDTIRLCITQDNDRSDYIALSYCWGQASNQLLTTSDNLQEHLQRIQLSSMSRTHVDAVKIARRLGIRYIWIDALCIVQGDREDWAREAALMHRVYSRAALTIGSLSASTVDDPLLTNRSDRHHVAVPIQWPFTTGPYASDEPYRLYMLPYFAYSDDSLSNTPLSSRAWTFQERTLSARFLHFGPELTHWECRKSSMNEDQAVESSHSPYGLAFFNTVYEGQELTKVRLLDGWATAIAEYTKRRLTVSGDKLPALAGVARVYGEQQKLGGYIAGLWEEQFPKHLLWQADHSGGIEHRRVEPYRAPTWSWVSIDGPVVNPAIQRAFSGMQMLDDNGYETRHTYRLADISATVDRDDADDYGIVNSGHIKARGVLLQLDCKKRSMAPTGDVSSPGIELRMRACRVGDRSLDIGGLSLGSCVLDVQTDQMPFTVWIFPILLCTVITLEDRHQLCEVLVLKDVSSTHQTSFTGKVFERIGKGRVRHFLDQRSVEDFTII